MVVGWQAVIALIFFFGARAFSEMMSDDPAVIQIAIVLFIMVAILQIADGVQATALGALRGMFDMNIPTWITLAAYWPLALPAAYLFGFVLDFGAVGIWLGYMIGLAVAAVLLPIRFWRLTRGKRT